jgi:hypothetical protein
LNLGREDQLDVEGLKRLMGSIGRYLDITIRDVSLFASALGA